MESRKFAGVPASVADARMFVSQHLTPNTDAYHNAILLVSEAASNAVKHAMSDYVVTVDEETEGVVKISVRDEGEIPDIPLPRMASPSDEGGRGLGILEAVANAWGAEIYDHGTNVWFELDLYAPEANAA